MIVGDTSHLGEPSGLVVLLPVEEPVGDLVLAGVGHDGHETLELLSRALACSKKGSICSGRN